MLLKEIIDVCTKNHMKPINTKCKVTVIKMTLKDSGVLSQLNTVQW
jgi:hypothetical protein